MPGGWGQLVDPCPNPPVAAGRAYEPPEAITFHAHAGECRYCKHAVKMHRSLETNQLLPDDCRCLFCAQPYFVKVDDIMDWENEQWKQRAALDNSGGT